VDTLLPGADALFEQAACGLLLTDADGLILRANATLRGWLGYEEDELAGKRRMPELLTMGARLFHHTHCLPMLHARGAVAEIQIELYHRHGQRLPVLVNIVRCLQAGRVVDQWAVFQSADRRKDDFLATLSHELRNPLAPMRNALDVMQLKEDRGGAAAPDGRLLQAFDRQLRHLPHLVDDLMEVSRITQGRMQLRRAPVELGALVQGALQDLAGALRNARHTLRLDLAGPPLLVDGDATRLSQVVVNLLNNAIKYTPAGGAGMPEAMRVLVVDDNHDAAEALTTALGMYGCDTRMAHTAQSALALTPSFGPDAVLLDIGLPDLNGYELARRLRKLPGSSALTVIATTGWGQDKDRQRAFEAGCDHHLTKPIDVERLRGLLGQRSCA